MHSSAAITRTRSLAGHAAAFLKSKNVSVLDLDLAGDVPDLLTPERVSAYYRRNYAGETLGGQDLAQLKKMDRMTDQLMAADLLVQDEVLAELKAVKALDEIHLAQCLNYLKATGLRVCLLINFGNPKVEIRRIML